MPLTLFSLDDIMERFVDVVEAAEASLAGAEDPGVSYARLKRSVELARALLDLEEADFSTWSKNKKEE